LFFIPQNNFFAENGNPILCTIQIYGAVNLPWILRN
jgi:hypothetical protein